MAAAALPWIGVGLGSAGLLGQVISGEREAQAAREEGRRRQQAAEMQARETIERAKFNVETVRREGEALTGEQVSSFARAGVDISSGSPLLVLAEAKANAEREIFNIQREAEFEAQVLRAGGMLQLAQGREVAAATRIRTGATLLTGASSIIRDLK